MSRSPAATPGQEAQSQSEVLWMFLQWKVFEEPVQKLYNTQKKKKVPKLKIPLSIFFSPTFYLVSTDNLKIIYAVKSHEAKVDDHKHEVHSSFHSYTTVVRFIFFEILKLYSLSPSAVAC